MLTSTGADNARETDHTQLCVQNYFGENQSQSKPCDSKCSSVLSSPLALRGLDLNLSGVFPNTDFSTSAIE